MANLSTHKSYVKYAKVLDLVKNHSIKPEVIIRQHCYIKSRQWWLNLVTKLKRISKIHLSRNKLAQIATYTLLITKNKEIKKLNHKYRKKNKPTDVLSFYLKKDEQIKNKYLGDIVISIDKAKEQSIEKNVSLENELTLLLVHGYLHLLGYDHIIKSDAKKMFTLQDRIFKKFL